MTDWSKLLSESEVQNAMRERKKTYLEQTAWKSSQAEEESEGWQYFKDSSNPKKIKMRKDKPVDAQFENRVWVLFASMGFKILNRSNDFTIDYSLKGQNLTKQIDVFAVDDETALVVECKCAESPKEKTWKTELEAINGYMQQVRSEIIKQFPNRSVKFIFATHNYIIGDQDRKRMEEFGIALFDDRVIKYYEELAKHLGSCARYQLLGSLFANKQIRGMDNRIPAIRGTMGGYTYYSFCIEPETLLKISYVLHRSEANEDMMPTYQRIIKKARLKSVHEFIEGHGFFPNSLLISVETKNKRPLQFDLADKQGNSDTVKLGILHLPNEYRTAYIIDGQHRLYGYSDSQYAKTNSIPVVAFENMDQKQQVKLFMEINENQKAVSKNLRNTLNADLLWVSDNPSERREALRSKMAQEFGDNIQSPLHDRVQIGEDQADDFRCITLENICLAIDRSCYLTKFSKGKTPTELGLFDLDDNEKTITLLRKYLFGCFAYLKEILPDEWTKNPKTDGIVLINNGVGGFIQLFGDIALELKKNGNDPKQIDDFLEETHYYLDPIADFIANLSADSKSELRTAYGGNGPRNYWRSMQKAVHEAHNTFLPEGYTKYWEEHGKAYNEESVKIMSNAESKIKAYIRAKLMSTASWIQEIPKKVYTNATTEASKAEYETGVKKDVWEYFSMADLCDIVLYGSNWQNLFEKVLTLPSEVKKSGGKKAKTEWMLTIDKLQRSVGRANFSVAKTQYEVLKEVESILIRLSE